MESHLDTLWKEANESTIEFWCHLMVLGPDLSKGQSFFCYRMEAQTLLIGIDLEACIRTMTLRPFFNDKWVDILSQIPHFLLYWFPEGKMERTSVEFPPLLPKSKGIFIPDHVMYEFVNRLWLSRYEVMVNVMEKAKALTTSPLRITVEQSALLSKNPWLTLLRSTHFQPSGRESRMSLFGPCFSHVTMTEGGRITHFDRPRPKNLKKRKYVSSPSLVAMTSASCPPPILPQVPLVPIHLLHFPSFSKHWQ
jgi:hypothetical protein